MTTFFVQERANGRDWETITERQFETLPDARVYRDELIQIGRQYELDSEVRIIRTTTEVVDDAC